MKTPFRPWALAAAAALACAAMPSAAEDIDLYAGVNGSGGLPNVLFWIDNTSNWSTASEGWSKASVTAKCDALTDATKKTLCLGYVSTIFGAATTLTQGQIELRALKLVLSELVCSATQPIGVNVGLMLYNTEGTVDSNSANSGYIRHHIGRLDAAKCTTLLADLDAIDASITTPSFKGPSSGEYGTPLYEAFKYFGGWTNPAGAKTSTAGTPASATGFGPIRNSKKTTLEDSAAFDDASTKTTYKSPISEGNCGNNYIVLIGNKWPNQEYQVNQNPNPPTYLQFSSGRLNYATSQISQSVNPNNKSDIRFADEWAKFLYDTDVSSVSGQQNIRMFTVDVFNDGAANSSDRPKQASLLKSMADQTGPGGDFTVGGDLYALINAFKTILTKIAAVNSVFASPSLPVSVNAQGTFLNQVFMGVFRPDGDKQQRWLGNLKQYRFALDGTSLYLADATDKNGKPRPAVDSQGTGFIDSCATSYWTSDTLTYWQTLTPGLNSPSNCETDYPGSAHSDKPDGPIVERGGVAHRIRVEGHASRNIRTCTDDTCKSGGVYTTVQFNTTNVTSISATLVDWLRGRNVGDGIFAMDDASDADDISTSNFVSYGLADTATRPTVHGEVVHSRPLAINYGTGTTTDVVVYYGAGDGTLRAINGNQAATDGNELWAFIAPEHWLPANGTPLDRVRTNLPLVLYPTTYPPINPAPTAKTWYFDGSIGGYQERTLNSVDKVLIFASMRRGGSSVYTFDVTNKPSSTNQPVLQWKYSATDEARMGQSWSTPTAIRVQGYSNPLVVFGAGYDNCEDSEDPNTACSAITKGQGVVVVDGLGGPTSSNYRFIGVNASDPEHSFDSTAGRFVADITAVDINRDGFVDVLYAADTRGNLWRINTSNPAGDAFTGLPLADWKVNKIATVGQWGASLSERRKFMNAPSVVALGNQVTVLIGTGDREKPSDQSNAAQVINRFYGFRDDISVVTGVIPAIGYGAATDVQDIVAANGTQLKNVTDAVDLSPTALIGFNGWFRNLESATAPYEQVVTTPLTLGGVTYFNTYRAKDTAGSNTCVNLGTGFGYQIDFQTGSKLSDRDLVDDFVTEGIPPSPVGGTVIVDGKTVPFCIGCPGDSVLDPTKITPKVKPDRKPVYLYQRIDKN
jgi:type IV pilus assembly protein PilY1